ncbi:BTB/POZ domain-containing protein At3g08570 isoform X1 [Amborella trichopoda]|uniref:BTB/POZ domain-containing protein At3g08570 isoform X1 n=1 Tax=Amborella trichopoda TaxID=13333 RepID=UPI0009BD26D7|nr:BTB/POZ domain-containing protein At3g08570 isoform X1 [Amborella trichopoda]|eukprot:XP_020521808.1 BTB/POZ domain-containing protein At3g08570 isoform X1 [Amborella trichopoda]
MCLRLLKDMLSYIHRLMRLTIRRHRRAIRMSFNMIFSDVAGDIIIDVDGQPFVLHKFPLVSQSGRIRKILSEVKDSEISKLELPNFPGGSHTFELAVKFCYGTNFEITPTNVAHIRCAAEYLEMTEDYSEENLIPRTETYLTEIVMQSLEKSVEVLHSCEVLLPETEEVKIPCRCIDAIAVNASKEQLVSGLSRLDCNSDSGKLNLGCQEWWIEDLSVIRIDLYQRVIVAMRKTGVRPDSIVSSLTHYAQSWLKGPGKQKVWDPARLKSGTGLAMENDQRLILETLVGLLPTEKSATIPMSFLFGMLRMAIMLDSSTACRLELERRIGFHLEMVTLDDLLIPSLQAGDSLFDIDTVHRILVNFFQRIEEEESEESQFGYESEGFGSPSHGSVLKVGKLIDGFLAEIAPDPYLKLQKFMAIIELLPDYAHVVDDGLYRAVDIYLKAHPGLTEAECRRLCKLVDCQKLTPDASNHAAQNDRLPVHMALQVLYLEQLRIKNALAGNFSENLFSQRISSGVPSATMSPRDNYASLRRENRELRLEISRMRMRLNDLEKEQANMKRGMDKRSANARTFLGSISKGFGRMTIFGPATRSGRKGKRAGQGQDGKSGRRRRQSVS